MCIRTHGLFFPHQTDCFFSLGIIVFSRIIFLLHRAVLCTLCLASLAKSFTLAVCRSEYHLPATFRRLRRLSLPARACLLRSARIWLIESLLHSPESSLPSCAPSRNSRTSEAERAWSRWVDCGICLPASRRPHSLIPENHLSQTPRSTKSTPINQTLRQPNSIPKKLLLRSEKPTTALFLKQALPRTGTDALALDQFQ